MISVGVSTACLHPQETAESIEYLCQHSIQSFEVFLNTSIYFRDGIHVLFSDYSPRLKDGLQLYEQYFRIQKIAISMSHDCLNAIAVCVITFNIL